VAHPLFSCIKLFSLAHHDATRLHGPAHGRSRCRRRAAAQYHQFHALWVGTTAPCLTAIAPLLRVRPEIQEICRFAARWEAEHHAEPLGWSKRSSSASVRSASPRRCRGGGVYFFGIGAALGLKNGGRLRGITPRLSGDETRQAVEQHGEDRLIGGKFTDAPLAEGKFETYLHERENAKKPRAVRLSRPQLPMINCSVVRRA